MVRMRVVSMGLGIIGIAAVMGVAGCGSGAGTAPAAGPAMTVDSRAADEEAIRAADLGWSKAAGAKDAAGTASYYAEDALLMAPMTPVVKGRAAIQAAFAGMMKDPNFALSFSPTRVVVAKSGELAYDYGNFQLTVSEKKGKANTLKAMYVVVWGKQADGSWKALADVPTSSSE